jgi:hypothetical protein
MYAGPVIDAHTHPLLYPEGQIGEPHPPEDYRRRAADSAVTRAAALVIAPRGDLAATRRRNDATLGWPATLRASQAWRPPRALGCSDAELAAVLYDNAAALLG